MNRVKRFATEFGKREEYFEYEMKEIHHSDGLKCGGLDVDNAFMDLSSLLFGDEMISKYRRLPYVIPNDYKKSFKLLTTIIRGSQLVQTFNCPLGILRIMSEFVLGDTNRSFHRFLK